MEAVYKIIGGDGAEYGPATLDELRSWIRDGRVAGMTKVWRSDLAQCIAERYSELGSELARLHAAAATAASPCGFWARLAAYVIDMFIIGVMFQLIWMQLGMSQKWVLPTLPTETTDAAIHQFMAQSQGWFNHALPIFLLHFLWLQRSDEWPFWGDVGQDGHRRANRDMRWRSALATRARGLAMVWRPGERHLLHWVFLYHFPPGQTRAA